MGSRKLLLRGAFIVFILMLTILSSQHTEAQTSAAPGPSLTLVWATKFEGDAVLVTPGDIGVDQWGNIFVSTQGNNSVKKFDAQGNFVMQWGDGGKEPGNFSLSLGVAVDADNNVYVSDFYNKRIQKFDDKGKFLLQWPNETSTSPAFLGADAQGNVYADEFPPADKHYLEKFDVHGRLVGEWGNESGITGSRIEDIAVDKDGNIFVADPIGHRVQKLDTNGKLVATWGGKASMDGNGLFFDPFGIAVDTDGNVYVLDSNFLQKLDSTGKFIAQWSTHGGDLDKASNVMVDKAGDIYLFAKTDVTTDSGTIKVFVLKKFQQS